jgi:hypothetical protein
MSTLKQRAAWSQHSQQQDAKRKKKSKVKKKMTPVSRKGKSKFKY